ncbi:MAG TPA: HDOD domain-containing protein [Steroidobacteraceae bacterium]|jgi:HD-like signal output (HDOD) protein
MQELESPDRLRGLVERHLARNGLAIPKLPEVAVRVVESGTTKAGNAQVLADIIHSDAILTEYVLHIVASAAKRPALPIASLQHAIAWLGIDEVANIAFTLALQAKILHVEGQQRRARRLWRHSLASALWSRQVARRLGGETGVCYLCGLLHNIGKAVTLGTVHDVAQLAEQGLDRDDYDRLIELFHRDVGRRVISAWALPPPVPMVIAHWEDYASAGAVLWESNVVNVAHKLADFTLHEPEMMKRDVFMMDKGFRDLGLSAQDAVQLFDATAEIIAEMDRYLSP